MNIRKSPRRARGRARRKSRQPTGRVRQALRDSAARLRMALEAAEMVTWEWDLRTGSIQYSDNVPVVARGEAVKPYGSVDGLLQAVHPADRRRLAWAVDRTREEGAAFECEYRVRMLDGRYHWMFGKGKSVVVEKGNPVRVLGISQDITARKQAEAEIRRRSRQLAELASELTMVEHRERRRIAEVMHENLQQILVAACLEAETVAASADTKTRRQGKALHGILSKALAVARGMTQELAPPVSLRKNLPMAFDWLAAQMFTRYKLDVDVQIHESLKDTMESVGVLLFTAARELLLNVVKHSGTRQARLGLRRHAGALVLDVSDKGKGIRSRSPLVQGPQQGFGLFSIRERAELLGGKLVVESNPGRGTRAELSLPLPKQGSKSRAS